MHCRSASRWYGQKDRAPHEIIDFSARHAIDPIPWRAPSLPIAIGMLTCRRVRRRYAGSQVPPQPRSWSWRRRPSRRPMRRRPLQSRQASPSPQPTDTPSVTAYASGVAHGRDHGRDHVAGGSEHTVTDIDTRSPDSGADRPDCRHAGGWGGYPESRSCRTRPTTDRRDRPARGRAARHVPAAWHRPGGLVRRQHGRHHVGQPGPRERLGPGALDSTRSLLWTPATRTPPG